MGADSICGSVVRAATVAVNCADQVFTGHGSRIHALKADEIGSLCRSHDDLELRGDRVAGGLAMCRKDMHSGLVEAVPELGILFAVGHSRAVVKFEANRAAACSLEP